MSAKRKGTDWLTKKALDRYGVSLPTWAAIQSRVHVPLIPGTNGEIIVISNDNHTPFSVVELQELKLYNTDTIAAPPTRAAYICYSSPSDTSLVTMCHWVYGTPYAEFEKACRDELAWHMINVEGSGCVERAKEYCRWTLRVIS